jgi:uncharacterized protein (DUF1015 family)
MSKILPFNGQVPPVEKVAEVAAVPYDVVNSREAAELAAGNPLSFLRVSRPEIELEAGIDLHDDKVYAQAAINYQRLIESAPLTCDAEKHLYVYRLIMDGNAQTGVLGAGSTAEYEAGLIKKHEKTRTDKEDDRTRHLLELRSHTGPVFLTYRDSEAIDAMIDTVVAGAPLFDFTAPDGIQHTLWRMSAADSSALSELFEDVPALYIADGHHRAAAAARTAAVCREANPNHTGDEDYNYFLTVTFPATQLKILAYNRAVKELNGLTKQHLLTAIDKKFKIVDAASPVPSKPGVFCMYIGGDWYELHPEFDTFALGVTERLDVSILQDNILAPLLDIADPRTSTKIDFIGGIRGTDELEKLVDSGTHAVAFSMYPTTMDQLLDIADAGAIMPPKSTWFEPKLRDGLVSHTF